MKKICVVTASRSEYGMIKWLMHDIIQSELFKLQIIVTGGHLSYEQGHTIDAIINDGFEISETIDVGFDGMSEIAICEWMGRLASEISRAYDRLKPDYVMVVGDRYELLPICNTAFVLKIPIIHISGGDVTEGAIDNGIRNAVTMLSSFHFAGNSESTNNIIRMRGSNKNVWNVGEPGLDSFYREKLMTKSELALNLGLDLNKQWVLMTYHPETRESLDYNTDNVKHCIEALLEYNNIQAVITYANLDFGGAMINEIIAKYAEDYPDSIKAVPSLGNARYLSFMHFAKFIIGNSSSGIVEAPSLNIPVINIGDRQKGRYLCSNVFQCNGKSDDIKFIIKRLLASEIKKGEDLNYYGDGHTSEKILSILRSELIK